MGGQWPSCKFEMTRALLRRVGLQRLQQEVGEIDIPRRIPFKKIEREAARRMKAFSREFEAKSLEARKIGTQAFTADFLGTLRSVLQQSKPRTSIPESPAELARFLPYFDWRLSGNVPPVRDQGDCNSCWAFAATQAYESRLNDNLNKFRISVDPDAGIRLMRVTLSVQSVLDCVSKEKGDCTSGFHMAALDHFVEKGAIILDARSEGMRFDSQQEIMGRKGDCKESEKRGLKAVAWDFVADSPDEVPAVETLKKALLEHGPLPVFVLINNQFAAYRGGVFPQQDPNDPNQTDHALLLTGWDDRVGRRGNKGAWILQNSFGPDWGESCVDLTAIEKTFPMSRAMAPALTRTTGCMYMSYGANSVGRFAAWVEAPLTIPSELIPMSM